MRSLSPSKSTQWVVAVMTEAALMAVVVAVGIYVLVLPVLLLEMELVIQVLLLLLLPAIVSVV